MKTSPDGVYALAKHEGIVPAPYKDVVGVWTYGIGHTAGAGAPIPAEMAKGMPDDLNAALRDVLKVFEKDLLKFEVGVRAAFTVPLKQHEFDAAVSFHYNTGRISNASWVRSFNEGKREQAIAQIMNWKKPKAIIPRREDEQRLFATGEYPKGDVAMYPADENGNVQWNKAVRIPKVDFLAMVERDTPPASKSDKPVKKGGLIATILALLASIFGVRK